MSKDSEYELTPAEEKPRKPRPGDPDFVPPIPIIITADKSSVETVPVDPDVEKNKGMAILGYIFFVIPLISAPNSRFARFHANQGLFTFVLWFIAVFGVILANGVLFVVTRLFFEKINILYYFFSCIFYVAQPILLLGALVATIYGIIQAANGERKRLPFIGHFTLIKEDPTPVVAPAATPAAAATSTPPATTSATTISSPTPAPSGTPEQPASSPPTDTPN